MVGGIVALLALSSLITAILKSRQPAGKISPVIANLDARVRAWWVMVAIFSAALFTGGLGSVILFALTSFFALREFVTLTPTRAADHRALFWAFFIVVPAQYVLVAQQWYGLFAIFIPSTPFFSFPSAAPSAATPNTSLSAPPKSSGPSWCVCIS